MSVLHIVLLILKIVGLLLLGLLGLVVSLLVLLLFVPFRYQINLKKTSAEENAFHGVFYIHWLLHIVHVKAIYQEKDFKYCFRIFGIPIKQNKTEKAPKKKKANKVKKNSSKKSKEKEKKSLPKNSKEKPQNKPIKKNVVKSAEKKSITKEQVIPVKEENKKPKKKSFKEWLKNKIQIVQDTIRKIIEKLRNIKETIQKLLDKKNKVFAYIKEETTKNSLRKSRKSVIKLLKYAGPQKIKGVITYGLEDPSQTGMSLGAISVIYAYYSRKNKKLKVIPDFEQARFEADVKITGRFRNVRVLFEVLKLIRDKEFKTFIKNGKQLKEEF